MLVELAFLYRLLFFFYLSPPVCLLSVTNLAPFQSRTCQLQTSHLHAFSFHLAFCSVCLQLFLIQRATSRGKKPPDTLRVPLLILAGDEQREAHTCLYTFNFSTSLADTTSYCNLSACRKSTAPRIREGQISVSLIFQFIEGKKAVSCIVALVVYKSSLYHCSTGRQKASQPWDSVVFSKREKLLYYIKFRR